MSESSQCPQCGPFPQKSFQYNHEYHTSHSLQRLRSSNLPATDEEIGHVQTTFLRDIRCERVNLEARFAILSRVVASMKEECDALRTLEDKYQGLVSVHRALPRELWSEIFLYAQSDEQDFDPLKPSGIIWRLSHVCQAWRDVALSLDSFWSHISMSFGSRAQTEKMAQLLQLVLSRSRLLDIKLCDSSAPLYRDPFRSPILDMVLSQSHRWRSAYLMDSGDAFRVNGLYAPIRCRLPQLRSLSLYTYGEGANVQLFEDCPLLTKVTLSSCAVDLPVAQIRELNIGTALVEAGYPGIIHASLVVIRQCPVLEVLSCVFTHSLDKAAVQLRADIVITPTIRTLQTNSIAIIDNLILPSLQEAVLLEAEPSDDASLDNILKSFEQLLGRSYCARTLTHLKLVNIPLRSHAAGGSNRLISLLVETNQLAVLELNLSGDRYSTDVYTVQEREHLAELMRALQVTEESGILLPCLSAVKIVMTNCTERLPPSQPPNDLWGDFPAMLTARWEGDGLARLHTFHVVLRDVVGTIPWGDDQQSLLISSDELAILEGLVEAGMNLLLDIRFTDFGCYYSTPRSTIPLVKVPSMRSSSFITPDE